MGICDVIDQQLDALTEALGLNSIESVAGIPLQQIVDMVLILKRIADIVELISTYAGMAVQAAETVIDEVGEEANKVMSTDLFEYAAKTADLKEKLQNGELLPSEATKLTRELSKLTSEFNSNWGEALGGYGTDVGELVSGLTSSMGEINTAIGNAIEGIEDVVGEVTGAVNTAIGSIMGDCSKLPNISMDSLGNTISMPSVPKFPTTPPMFDSIFPMPKGLEESLSKISGITDTLTKGIDSLETDVADAFSSALDDYKLTDKFEGILEGDMAALLPDISNPLSLDISDLDNDYINIVDTTIDEQRKLLVPKSMNKFIDDYDKKWKTGLTSIKDGVTELTAQGEMI